MIVHRHSGLRMCITFLECLQAPQPPFSFDHNFLWAVLHHLKMGSNSHVKLSTYICVWNAKLRISSLEANSSMSKEILNCSIIWTKFLEEYHFYILSLEVIVRPRVFYLFSRIGYYFFYHRSITLISPCLVQPSEVCLLSSSAFQSLVNISKVSFHEKGRSFFCSFELSTHEFWEQRQVHHARLKKHLM